MSYPKILFHLQKDVLTEIFSLTLEDTRLIERIRSDKNILGFSVLLKSFQHLGYPPPGKNQIPIEVVEQITSQLELSPELFQEFRWRKIGGQIF